MNATIEDVKAQFRLVPYLTAKDSEKIIGEAERLVRECADLRRQLNDALDERDNLRTGLQIARAKHPDLYPSNT